MLLSPLLFLRTVGSCGSKAGLDGTRHASEWPCEREHGDVMCMERGIGEDK